MPRYDLDSAVYQKGFAKKEEQQKAYLQNKYHFLHVRKTNGDQPSGRSSLISGDINLTGVPVGWWILSEKGSKLLLLSSSVLHIFSYHRSGLETSQDENFDAALNQAGSDHADYAHNTLQCSRSISTGESIIFHNYKKYKHQ